jgi:hypothetical protein
MRATGTWAMALPLPDTERVVTCLVDGFHQLKAFPKTYKFAEKETNLTKRLTLHLQNTQSVGLAIGFWDFEVSTDTKNEDDPRRLDIRFSTVVNNSQKVLLIFECKKLGTPTSPQATRHRRSYIDEGIARFVKGSYAPTEPLGFLIAFVEYKTSTAMVSLKQALGKSTIQGVLNMIKHSNNQYIAEPPDRFASHALFSTEHVRQINGANVTQTIALYHIPLTF